MLHASHCQGDHESLQHLHAWGQLALLLALCWLLLFCMEQGRMFNDIDKGTPHFQPPCVLLKYVGIEAINCFIGAASNWTGTRTSMKAFIPPVYVGALRSDFTTFGVLAAVAEHKLQNNERGAKQPGSLRFGRS